MTFIKGFLKSLHRQIRFPAIVFVLITSMEKPSSFGIQCSYISTIVQMLLIVTWLLTSQLIGDGYPAFGINAIRFSLQTLICISLVRLNKQSIFAIAKSDIVFLILSSLAYPLHIIMMYLASSRLPLGNMEGTFAALYVIFNVIISTAKRRADWLQFASAMAAVIGVMCIVQPTILFGTEINETGSVDKCPCVTMSNEHRECNAIYDNTYNAFFSHNESVISTNWYDASRNSNTSNATSNQDNDESSIDNTMGYIYISLAALFFGTSTQNNSSHLLTKHHFSVISFWSVMSGVVMCVVLSALFDTSSFLSFPLCIITAVLGIIFLNIAWKHVPPTEFAILDTLGVVILFIAQYTFMRKYHSPHGNLLEIMGALLVIFSCLLHPISILFKKST